MFTGMRIIMNSMSVWCCVVLCVAWFCDSFIRFPRPVLPVRANHHEVLATIQESKKKSTTNR